MAVLQEIEGVFQNKEGNWCRICSQCGAEVEHKGQFSRISALNSTRQKIACRYCSVKTGGFGDSNAMTKKKVTEKLISEHSGSSLETEREYEILCHVSNNQSPSYQEKSPSVLFFKTKMIECSVCGHRKMQSVPTFFTEFRHFCHNCKARQIVKV